MDGKSLYDFYEKALLPQFGIKDQQIVWKGSSVAGPDEEVHYFAVASDEYALIFEDAGGLGSNEAFVKEVVDLPNGKFEYIKPISHSDYSLSYPITFPVPYDYCYNITGMFTLVKI